MSNKTAPKSKRTSTRPIAKSSPPAPSLRDLGTAGNGKPSEDEIRFHAYLKWEAAGRPEGDGAEFWLMAEQELQLP